jgi:hypothetical protein
VQSNIHVGTEVILSQREHQINLSTYQPARAKKISSEKWSFLICPAEDNCRVRLIEHLGAERKNDAKKLHRAITSHANSVRSGLKSASAPRENPVREW